MIEHLDPLTDADRLHVIETVAAGHHGHSYKFRVIRAALDAPDWQHLFAAQTNAHRAEDAAAGSEA